MSDFYDLYSQPLDARCPNDRFDPMEKLREAYASCTKCTLPTPRSIDNKVVLGHGVLHCKVMFIGDQPSVHDRGTGVPFSDKMGEVVTRIALRLGVTDSMYCTLTSMCHAGDHQTCESRLHKEIQIVNPTCLIVFGADAAKKLGVKNNVHDRHMIKLKKYYPVYVMHDIQTLFFLPKNQLESIKKCMNFILKDMNEIV